MKSCIFHFVFETIHPFPDGNGRMGRLWQTVILGRWNPLFYALPIENMVLCHQRRYYQTLHSAQKSGDARVFVDFMLDMILRTLKEFVSRSAIQKHIERLKDAQRLRRIGPDKGGHWEVIEIRRTQRARVRGRSTMRSRTAL